jgi:hypothetical protein
MNHLNPARFPAAILILLSLTFLLPACSGPDHGKQNPTVTDGTTHMAQQANDAPRRLTSGLSDPVRMVAFNKLELDSAKKLFTEHFTVEPGNKSVTDAVLRIPWDALRAAGASAVPSGKIAAGIAISYGLDGTAFHPIIRFLYQDRADEDYSVSTLKAFSFTGGKLNVENDTGKYEKAYRDNIRIVRVKGGTPDKLRQDNPSDLKDEPDPLTISFPYANKLNKLILDNKADTTMLVVSCISENIPYRSLMAYADAPEYRHLIALHVGNGNTDMLDTPSTMPGSWSNLAMDLGVTCPPNCSPRKP